MRFALSALALAVAFGASAVRAEELTVYTTRQQSLIEPIFKAFEKDTGVTVKAVFAKSGLLERLQAEGANSPADLMIAPNAAEFFAAKKAGVLGAVTGDEAKALEAAIPAHLRDSEGAWFGLTTRARILYVSKDRVPADAKFTYEGLADPAWKGKICARPGSHPYNLALISAYIAHHGAEKAEGWLKGLKANLARKPQGGDRDQAKAIWAGECDIAIGNSYYLGEMASDPEQKAWAEAVRPAFPTFEGGGAHVNISGAAVTKNAPHRAAAIKLMNFMISPEAQKIYAELNHEYPVAPGVKPSEMVASWGTFTADETPLEKVEANGVEALKLVERVGFDE